MCKQCSSGPCCDEASCFQEVKCYSFLLSGCIPIAGKQRSYKQEQQHSFVWVVVAVAAAASSSSSNSNSNDISSINSSNNSSFIDTRASLIPAAR
jgi:hypothetical protein